MRVTFQKGDAMKPAPLSGALKTILDQVDGSFPDAGHRVFEIWPKAVGPDLVKRAKPLSIRGGQLTVAVEGAAWLQELSLQKKLVVDNINRLLGSRVVKTVKFVAGIVPPPQEPAEAPFDLSWSKRELTGEELAEIEKATATIADGEIKKSMAELMATSLKRASLKGGPK